MRDIRPPQIVECLDQYVIGQDRAKRAIAVAIRNRWRALKAGTINAEELTTQRYALAGPRGSGKTSCVIAAAATVGAPFARVHMAQLATHDDAGEATAKAVEAIVESARQLHPSMSLDDALCEVEQAGMLLIDGIDRWSYPGDDSSFEPLEAAQQALYTLAATSSVTTSYGTIATGNIMMFATGAVFASRGGDTPYDLQALFPKRIDFDSLGEDDLLRMVETPEVSPVSDYVALLRTEGVNAVFTPDGLQAVVAETVDQNRRIEDLGARRLVGIVETVLDELLYDPPVASDEDIIIDAEYVTSRIASSSDDEDLEDFIL